MITVYYGVGISNQNTFEWFKKYKIKVVKRKISQITNEDLLNVLSNTVCGRPDIMKNSSKSKDMLKRKISTMDNMTFNEAVHFIKKDPEIIKTPVIIEHNKIWVGYNSEEIRIFLPKQYRWRN